MLNYKYPSTLHSSGLIKSCTLVTKYSGGRGVCERNAFPPWLPRKPLGDFKDENLRRQQRPAETRHRRSRVSSVSAGAHVSLSGDGANREQLRPRQLANDSQPRINRSGEGEGQRLVAQLRSQKQHLRKLNGPLMRHWILNDNSL